MFYKVLAARQTFTKCFNILGTAGVDQKNSTIKVDSQQNFYNIFQAFKFYFQDILNLINSAAILFNLLAKEFCKPI